MDQVGRTVFGDLVALTSTAELMEAGFYRVLPEGRGIPAVIESTLFEEGGMPALRGGASLPTADRLSDRAVEILAARRGKDESEDEEADEEFEEEDETDEEEEDLEEYEDEDFDDYDEEDDEDLFYDDDEDEV